VLDVKVDFFSDGVDFQISPEPEVGGFLFDVLDYGKSDEFDLLSGTFLEFVDDEDGLLGDLFSLGFDVFILFDLELDDQLMCN
jgi:hypothetical protein